MILTPQKTWQKLLFIFFAVSCAVCLSSAVYIYRQSHKHLHENLEKEKKQALEQAQDASEIIGRDFADLAGLVDNIANDITSGKIEDKQLRRHLKDGIDSNQNIYILSASYVPFAFAPNRKLHHPTYKRIKDDNQLIYYEKLPYDYTLPPAPTRKEKTLWYHLPLSKGPMWMEPYFGTGAKTLLAEYSSPFYPQKSDRNTDKKARGIVSGSFSLEKIRNRVCDLNLGNTGYGFIITGSGMIVSHPIEKYLGKNINEFPDTDFYRIISRNNRQTPDTLIDHFNETTKEKSWVNFRPIPSTGWTMGIVLKQEELQASKDNLKKKQMFMFLAILSAILFGACLIFRVDQLSNRSLWIVSTCTSVLGAIGIIFIWWQALSYPSQMTDHNILLNDEVGVNVALHKFSQKTNLPAQKAIKTGIFLQSINFSSSYDVVVTGYVWQKKNKNPENQTFINPGIIFPEAESFEFKESFSNKDTIGWYFKATLRQQFDYSKYPFDREEVWIRLWHKDFFQHVFLAPDFASYGKGTNRNGKIGLEQDFVLEGWDIIDSYFSYRENEYNTNFGATGSNHNKQALELYFNVGVKRNFLDPFISHMIPLIVTAFLLFAVLLISTKSKSKIGILGFSVSSVLGYCAALFFVLIVSHVHLRESVASSGIIYLEYFYFVMYLAVLVISSNSILFASQEGDTLIHYNDNLIVKVLYWPVVQLLLLALTIYKFY